jgi:hypothetical protein
VVDAAGMSFLRGPGMLVIRFAFPWVVAFAAYKMYNDKKSVTEHVCFVDTVFVAM